MDKGHTGWPATLAPSDPLQFGEWLDRWLGRPMRIGVLRRACSPAIGDDVPRYAWLAQLEAYPCVWLRVEEIDDFPRAATLAPLAHLDLDVLLVCENVRGADGTPTSGAWHAAILDTAESLNLFEHMFIAWQGAGVTRAAARAVGYEDGFAPERPVSMVLAILGREAVTREIYRRRGSSPPCYL